MLAANWGEMGLSATVCRDGIGMGDGKREEGTWVGDSAREVVDIASISDIDGTVIFAGDSSFDLLAEIGVLEGVNVSGVSMIPWNELVEPVRSVRPRTK
jgi:hypothetical protein